MRKNTMKVLALAAIASMGLAACGSSGHAGSTGGSQASGKPLVVEGTPLSPFTDDVQPVLRSPRPAMR